MEVWLGLVGVQGSRRVSVVFVVSWWAGVGLGGSLAGVNGYCGVVQCLVVPCDVSMGLDRA